MDEKSVSFCPTAGDKQIMSRINAATWIAKLRRRTDIREYTSAATFVSISCSPCGGRCVCSADFHSAVSPTCSRQVLDRSHASALHNAWQSATLLYSVARWSRKQIVLVLLLVLDCPISDFENEDDDEDERFARLATIWTDTR